MIVFTDDDLVTCSFCGMKGCCSGCCEKAGWKEVMMPKTANQKKPQKIVDCCPHCFEEKKPELSNAKRD